MHLRLLQQYKPTATPSVGTPTREYFRAKIKFGKFKNLNQ